MRLRTLFIVVLAVCALGTGWSGEPRLELFTGPLQITARRVALDPANPARRALGRLTYLGGVHLESPDPAFGGFSALAVEGGRVTLLNDGGNLVRFRLRSDGRVSDVAYAALPGGPGTGWYKRDRDTEALALEPRTGRTWVAFERANQIWRYSADLTRVQRAIAPLEMRRWVANGGAETLARRRDGSFVAIEERRRRPWREMLVWAGDPTVASTPAVRLRYLPPAGYDPVDAVELPDGRLLVLNRWFGLPLRFANVLTVIERGALKPGATVRGREIARLAAPLTHDNFEGVATTVEQGRTILWLVSDDNQSRWERTLLLKFRLEDPPPDGEGGRRASRDGGGGGP
jgi:hypothetical protein